MFEFIIIVVVFRMARFSAVPCVTIVLRGTFHQCRECLVTFRTLLRT